MDIAKYISTLKRRALSDDIPGTYEWLDDLCPACGNKLKLKYKCCNNPNDIKECTCGYKIALTTNPL